MRVSWNESRKNKRRGREKERFPSSPPTSFPGSSPSRRGAGEQGSFPVTFPLPPFVCLFLLLLLFFFSLSRFKFSRNNSNGNGCYAGLFRVRIFCHRVPKLQTNCVTVRMLERFGGELTVEIRRPPSHVMLFNNLILRIDLLLFSSIHNVKFAQVLQVLLLFFPA